MVKLDTLIQFPIGISLDPPAIRMVVLGLFRKNIHQKIVVGKMPDKSRCGKFTEKLQFLRKNPQFFTKIMFQHNLPSFQHNIHIFFFFFQV